MPYYDDLNKEDEIAEGGGGTQLSPQSSVIAGQGATAPVQGTTTPTPDNPGNFVGIQKYLDANSSQASKLGDSVAGAVQGAVGNAREAVATLDNEANERIQPISALDEPIKQKIASTPEALTAEERNIAKNVANSSYTGPKGIEDFGDSYSKATSSVNAAKQQLDSTGSEAGRQQLIAGAFNAKPRTQGQNVFDGMLLQAGGGRQKLQNVAEQNADLRSEANPLVQTVDAINARIGRADDPSTPDVNEATGAIGGSAAAQQDAYSAIQSSLGNWTGSFTPKVASAQQALIDKQQALASDIRTPKDFTADNLALLGLNAGDRLWNLNLNNYIDEASPTDINAANVASAEDYARYAALAELAGLVPDNLLFDPTKVELAGTRPDLQVNQSKLKADMQARDAAYNKAYKSDNSVVPSLGEIPLGPGLEAAALYESAAGKSPEWIESVYLPQLSRQGTPAAREAAAAISDKLNIWKSNQHYNSTISKR